MSALSDSIAVLLRAEFPQLPAGNEFTDSKLILGAIRDVPQSLWSGGGLDTAQKVWTAVVNAPETNTKIRNLFINPDLPTCIELNPRSRNRDFSDEITLILRPTQLRGVN